MALLCSSTVRCDSVTSKRGSSSSSFFLNNFLFRAS
uniref:Uncharacterized protein n=1 Tax=Amphimedon queenslandica TaxID=400682 RepID=A0A1X7SIX9_AMPQE